MRLTIHAREGSKIYLSLSYSRGNGTDGVFDITTAREPKPRVIIKMRRTEQYKQDLERRVETLELRIKKQIKYMANHQGELNEIDFNFVVLP